MNSNRISVALPEEVITQVKQKISEINTLMKPYLASLTKEERESLPKMADKTLAFVTKVVEYVKSNPKYILTDFMDAAELKKDYDLYQDVLPLLALVNQVGKSFQDTTMLAGHEAYVAALPYYKNVKIYSDNGDATARAIYDDLKKRFPGRKTGKTKSEETSKS
jgi:hypothetical protein